MPCFNGSFKLTYRDSNHRFTMVLMVFFLALQGNLHVLFSRNYYYELNTIPLKGELANFIGNCFLQDSEGFMWFGAVDGLYRYDGSTYKIFRNEPGNPKTISNNMIFEIFEDKNGVIWIGTILGLSRFDKSTETFESYFHSSKNTNSLVSNGVVEIKEDQEGKLWIGTFNGLSVFNPQRQTFKNYKINSVYPGQSNYIKTISLQEDQFIWMRSVDNYKYRLNKLTDSLEIKGNVWNFPIYENVEGKYLVDEWGTYPRHLIKRSVESELKNPLNKNHLRGEEIRSIYKDKLENIWIRTNVGIHGYNQQLELIFYKAHSVVYSYSNRYYFSNSVLEDQSGSIWYSALNGIYQIVRKKKLFYTYDLNPRITENINAIAVDKTDRVWIASETGIYKLNRENKNFTQLFGAGSNRNNSDFNTLSLCFDREGNLWAGTAMKGVISMNTSGEILKHFKPHKKENPGKKVVNQNMYITKLLEDSKGRIWICSSICPLAYYDKVSERMIILASDESNQHLPDYFWDIFEVEKGVFYGVANSGIYLIAEPFTRLNDSIIRPDKFIACRENNSNNGEVNYRSMNFFMSKDGALWLGTSGYGLLRAIPLTGKGDTLFALQHYTMKNGLSYNDVKGVIEDLKGDIWVATEMGLSRFDTYTRNFTNYHERHGLPANYLHDAATLTKKGEILIESEGLVIFHPDSVRSDKALGHVEITELKIDHKTIQPGTSAVLKSSVLFVDSLDLKYNQNNLSFSYAMLSYIDPELNQYKYKLEGFHNDWIYAGNRTDVDFTNLKPGKYRFSVIAADSQGVWNEKGDSIYVTIKYPPWLTWYAYILYVVLFTIIILWIWRFQRNRIRLKRTIELERMEKEKIGEIDRIKSRFFANISHEFRTPLTLIRGPLDDLKKQKTKSFTLKKDLLDIMHRNTVRLQTLINQLLDISKMETGKVSLQIAEGKIDVLLRTVIQSFLSLAESKKVDYRFYLQEIKQKVWFDSDKIEKILINLISNAFKFTPEQGQISISCDFDNKQDTNKPQYINLKISDSGIGIPSDKLHQIFDRFFQVNGSNNRIAEGTGIGLALTKELVELYHGSIKVESTEGKGTTFTVRIPVAKEIFSDDELVNTSEGTLQLPLGEQEYMDEPLSKTSPDEKNNNIKPWVLIVEDNTDLANYISGILTDDYNIFSVENGQKGYDQAKISIPDLVISDLMMPVMDGMEMCHLLKENEKTSHIPIIMLTAKADRESKLEGLQNGADDYMIKPFDAEELKARVKNLIDQRNRLIEKFRKEWLSETKKEAPLEIADPFLNKLMALIEKHYSDYDFSVNEMAKKMNMSRAQFYRKTRALTGETPNELLRFYRIKKAAAMIRSGESNITGIIYEVGFKNTSHFAGSFKKYYGQNPSEYKQSHYQE